MGISVAQLAAQIGATLAGEADGDAIVDHCATLEEARPSAVTFLTNRKYTSQLAATQAAAVIVGKGVEATGKTLLVVPDDPYFAFRNAVVALHGFRKHPQLDEQRISPQAVVHESATIGAGTTVHPFAVIGPNAKIGENCVIYPHCFIGPEANIGDDCQLFPSVTVYDRCVLGNRVTLHAGCVIGQDGFGYATHAGEHHKIPQVGHVVVEDDVEMGANCSIDRATVGATVIGRGTKFSDCVTIGHGTKVGKHNLYVGLVGLAGSVQTGDYVVMGGQVGVAGHLKIGSNVQIAATSGVMTDIPSNSQVGGTPALPLTEAKRIHLSSVRLPDVIARVKKLERQLEKLTSSD
ncbi:MAG: UDP-3-O-(3-hydroxymyristoyl)glucosamine N-acyltransferase [Phycisphaeraceae bacterium]